MTPGIVDELGGSIQGEKPADEPQGVASLEDAAERDVAPYVDGRYRSHLLATRALLVLTDPQRAAAVVQAGRTAWVHPHPIEALCALIDRFHPAPVMGQPDFHAHRGAWIARDALLGPGVSVGAGCVIHAGVRLGQGTRVAEHAVVEPGVITGPNCVLGAACWLGHRTTLGARVTLAQGVVVGSAGFGLRNQEGRFYPIRHVGGVRIGDDVSLGPRTVVARGTLSDTVIGPGTRVDAHVQVGHNVTVGENCVIAAQAGIAGSSTLGDSVMVGGQAGIADHVHIGDGARIAARSGVIGDVPAGETWEGYPAMPRWKWLRAMARLSGRGE